MAESDVKSKKADPEELASSLKKLTIDPQQHRVKIHVINIGQGDSILVELGNHYCKRVIPYKIKLNNDYMYKITLIGLNKRVCVSHNLPHYSSYTIRMLFVRSI